MATIGRYEVVESRMKTTVVKKKNASIEDIMQAILNMHDKGLRQTKLFSNNFDFSNKRGFKKLWRTIRNDIKYVPDSPGKEIVKSPSALYEIGVGDCKSFTIASGTTMENAGIEVYYDLVHYGDKNKAHIYPVAILNGEEIIMDSVYHIFNQKHPGEKWRMRYDPSKKEVVSTIGIHGYEEFMQMQKMALIGGGSYFLLRKKNPILKIIGGIMIFLGFRKKQ